MKMPQSLQISLQIVTSTFTAHLTKYFKTPMLKSNTRILSRGGSTIQSGTAHANNNFEDYGLSENTSQGRRKYHPVHLCLLRSCWSRPAHGSQGSGWLGALDPVRPVCMVRSLCRCQKEIGCSEKNDRSGTEIPSLVFAGHSCLITWR